MTTISDTLYDPAGAAVAGVVVRATLVAASEVLTDGGAIIREAEVVTAAEGTWSLTLTPISSLAVSGGAYYLVTADGHRWTIDVPDSGAYALDDVQVEPGPLPSTGLSAATGVVLLDPPDRGGEYVGNTAQPPDPSQGASGNPWLTMQQPYSADDSNPDAIQGFSTTAGGAKIKTWWRNGNNEGRDAPSTVNRIARRIFEFYENLGGPSTGRYFELSTNPANSANREPLLGAYGTGSTTKPGWIEATRILSALLGVAVGGNYPTGNALGQLIIRGYKATAGAPVSGAYLAKDVVLALDGIYLCTAGGTPGTWVSLPAPSAYIDVTPGTNVAHATKHVASRLDRGGDSARLRGEFAVSGALTGAALGTITAAHRPVTAVSEIVRTTSGGALLQISTGGVITVGGNPTSGSVYLDGVTYDLL